MFTYIFKVHFIFYKNKNAALNAGYANTLQDGTAQVLIRNSFYVAVNNYMNYSCPVCLWQLEWILYIILHFANDIFSCKNMSLLI